MRDSRRSVLVSTFMFMHKDIRGKAKSLGNFSERGKFRVSRVVEVARRCSTLNHHQRYSFESYHQLLHADLRRRSRCPHSNRNL